MEKMDHCYQVSSPSGRAPSPFAPPCMAKKRASTLFCAPCWPRDTRIAYGKHTRKKLASVRKSHRKWKLITIEETENLLTYPRVAKKIPTCRILSNSSQLSGVATDLPSKHGARQQPKKLVNTYTAADRNEPLVRMASLLKRCGQSKALSDGKRVHAYMKRYGYDTYTFLGNCLVEMYGSCGLLVDARSAFDNIKDVNLYSWNILINAYVKNGRGKEALDLFHQMQLEGFKPDPYTFVSALNACAHATMLEVAQAIHASIVESGQLDEIVVGNALVSMYSKCGSFSKAKLVFVRMAQRNSVSWNAIIGACTQNGHYKEALDFLHQMLFNNFNPDSITFVCGLDACANLSALEMGHAIHCGILDGGLKGDLIVETALVNMYGKCGQMDDAENIFSQMSKRNVVSWNCMIAASAQNGYAMEALNYFHQMQDDGLQPNHVTFASALDACARLAALKEGQEIHAAIVRSGCERENIVWTALLDMYGKCGSLHSVRNVFGRMNHADVVSWNAMIGACAQNGYVEEALQMFRQMQEDGTKPDEVTFLSVLTACSHAGRFDDGRHYFFSMAEAHGLVPTLEHYVCMVDLLGRAGCLDDAEALINRMPFEKNSAVWLRLLAACRVHADVKRGIRVANSIFNLDPNNDAPFVLLSNVYAAAGGRTQHKEEITL